MNQVIGFICAGAITYFVSKKVQETPIPKEEQIKKQEVVENQSQLKTTINPIMRTLSINQRCYLLYSTLHKAPLAVHEFLDLGIVSGDAKRGDFFQDEQIKPEKFAVNQNYYKDTSAYRHFRYTRGHMAAAGNYSGNQEMKLSTFSYANTIPQHESNNAGIWNTFERYSRILLEQNKCDTLELISGPIYYSSKQYSGKEGKIQNENVYINQEKVLMKNGIIVPPKLYKIIKCNKDKKSYASGFTFENSETFDNDKTLKTFEESLESIQDQTGLEFKLSSDGPLSQYDQSGITKTKLHYDTIFYENLVKQSKSMRHMNENNRRAIQQKIYLENKVFQETVTRLYPLELEKIAQNSQTDCKKLQRLMYLHKDLFFVKSLKPYNEQLSKMIEQKITPCHSSQNDEFLKRSIGFAVSKEGRYYFPYQQRMKQLFVPFTEEKVTEKVESQTKKE